MRNRTLRTPEDVDRASEDLKKCKGHLPLVMTLTEGSRIRSESQNSRYWATLGEYVEDINNAIHYYSNESGYTDLEARHVLGEQLGWPRDHILMARKPEVVHEIAKMICGVPTSTRLGTKEFTKFEDIILDYVGEVAAEVRRAV